MNAARARIAATLVVLASLACGRAPVAPAPQSAPAIAGSLKEAARGRLMIGAALNANQFEGRDASGAALAERHFSTITPENVLKWEQVHPRPGVYDFNAADAFVAFGERNRMFIVGHTLVWHSQTPRWVFEDSTGAPLTRDALLARMRDHIHTVVGRYKGRINGWDVVNEAVDEDGTLRKTPWLNIIGEDYLVRAFEYAREADPAAELYYNDYSVENAPKREGVARLVQRLQAAGVRVAGVGLQGHNKLDWPSIPQQDSTISRFAGLGVQVMITELDVDVLPNAVGSDRGADVSLSVPLQQRLDPYRAGLPDSVQARLTQRYEDLFRVYLKHQGTVTRITFWGVADGDSWLNNWPVRGRTSYPLLFDRAGKPKPAFDALLRVLKQPNVVM